MSIFNVLSLIGGLCLFLFGMNIMGQSLERRAGGSLKTLLGKLTDKKAAGLLTGLGVTAVIQSSSATTVMVVGFVNSGLMSLKQSINVIMGANIGTTVTAWILSLAGIDSSNVFIKLLKPSSFTPVLALIGIILYMFCKKDSKKDTGMILLGFATLMFGMEAMSSAVSVLKSVPEFQQLFLVFTNPILGVLAGAVLTAIIQSSSASVGILQALASTGQVTYGAAVPIIMGQNIGTCVTALISSVGANKNAKRAAMVHLSFNVIGTVVWLAVFCIVKALVNPLILSSSASLLGISIVHTAFNVLCTLLMLPMGGLLEKLVCKIVPDSKSEEKTPELDERLLATPTVALARCRELMTEMAEDADKTLKLSINAVNKYSWDAAERIRALENRTDELEDMLGTYLVKISSRKLNAEDSKTAASYLKLIGDFERIADHSLNILESAEEMNSKNIEFSETAKNEMQVMTDALFQISEISTRCFMEDNYELAGRVEPLEEVIDNLKEKLFISHIRRVQAGQCSIETGYVWQDLLTNFERISDHYSNIAVVVLDRISGDMNMHERLENMKTGSEEFRQLYKEYSRQYPMEL